MCGWLGHRDGVGMVHFDLLAIKLKSVHNRLPFVMMMDVHSSDVHLYYNYVFRLYQLFGAIS